nr:cyclophilin-like fold protein [Bosea vaviloviae]
MGFRGPAASEGDAEGLCADREGRHLPGKLSTAGSAPGFDPSPGDIAYSAPWRNLAIFYRDFDYSPSLVRLGTIKDGVEALAGPGPLDVTIRIAPR